MHIRFIRDTQGFYRLDEEALDGDQGLLESGWFVENVINRPEVLPKFLGSGILLHSEHGYYFIVKLLVDYKIANLIAIRRISI